MSFFTRLERRAREIDSLLCVGLDPHASQLATFSAAAMRDYCLQLIEATWEVAVAFKPNAAFFEALGPEGVSVLQQIIRDVPDDVPVILDAKRGDIASTAQAYAQAAYQALGADAVTINPYLGYDSVAPFLGNPERGVFVLCKTSNPSAVELQELAVGSFQASADSFPDIKLYQVIAKLAVKWNQNDNVGLVVGATQPEALTSVREIAPDLWVLAPGIGAQGGDLDACLRCGLRMDGFGLLIPVSRSISRAKNPRKAAANLRAAINQTRDEIRSSRMDQSANRPKNQLSRLADQLLESGCIKFGDFRLKSGFISPIYIDLRRLVGHVDLLAQVAAAYLPVLRGLSFDRLGALPYAALPIATAISLMAGWPLIYPRKETKGYGTKSEIEGVYQAGERVVVIDDLATTGKSKFEAIEKLTKAGLQVTDIVVLIDRQSGAVEALAEAGYRMHSVVNLTQLLDQWENAERVPSNQIRQAREFIQATQHRI